MNGPIYPPATPGTNTAQGTDITSPLPEGERRKAVERITGGTPMRVYGQDPGFQPYYDPLDAQSKFRIATTYRDVPLVTIQNSWSVQDIRQALSQNMYGLFDLSGQLVDSILGDDRVQATMGSRIGGLFGREIRCKPANDSAAAKEVYDAWTARVEELLTSWALTETHAYGIMMGFAHGQIMWDRTKTPWWPMPRPWHPRYEWYEWVSRHYVAISQDGNIPIFTGDGKWYGHEPYGNYRAWVRGAVRAVAEPWAIRHFAIRDWARFSEVHGLPTRVGYTPATADPTERAQWESSLSSLGSDTTLLVPRGVEKDQGYDYKLVEATSEGWQAFPGLRDHCDLAIVLAIKFQNLTTEITSGGSYAAAREHGKVDVAQIAADNRAWRTTIARDFARPFAFINYGNADLAPTTDFDVPEAPREDYGANADALGKLMAALQAGAAAGLKFEDAQSLVDFAARQLGVKLPSKISLGTPPAETTAKAAMSTSEASHKTADAAVTSAEANKEKSEEADPEEA